MNKTISTLILSSVVVIASCASVSNTVKKYDHSTVYLQSDRYAAKRISVPGDLDTGNIDDFYPVPTIADQGDPKVPSLAPPNDEPRPKLAHKSTEDSTA